MLHLLILLLVCHSAFTMEQPKKKQKRVSWGVPLESVVKFQEVHPSPEEEFSKIVRLACGAKLNNQTDRLNLLRKYELDGSWKISDIKISSQSKVLFKVKREDKQITCWAYKNKEANK